MMDGNAPAKRGRGRAAIGLATALLAKLNDEVKKGQKVAMQRNAFGDVVHEYAAGMDGRVAIIGTDAIRERGVNIVTILASSADCPTDGCPYHGDDE